MFPDMSRAPYGLAPFGWAWTSVATLPHPAMLTLSQVASSLPHGNFRPSVPRAASSHSASVGKRFFAQEQYVTASARCTHEAGKLEPFVQSQSHVGDGQTPAVRHAEDWPCA